MNYRNPPIVEAVVQISFESPIAVADIDRVADRMMKHYSSRNDRQTITATIDTSTSKLAANSEKVGVELRDEYATKVLVLETNFILFSALAPYRGWDAFERRVVEDLERFRDVIGPLKVSRHGMRFVNRIDSPATSEAREYGRYVRAQPTHLALPNIPLAEFMVQITQPLPSEGASYTMSCASVPSPLPGFFGIAVDIDVSVTKTMSLQIKKTVTILREMRDQKNNLFESIITNDSRSIFGVQQ